MAPFCQSVNEPCASPKLYLRGKVFPKIQPGEQKAGGRLGRNGRGSIRSQLSRRGLAPIAAALSGGPLVPVMQTSESRVRDDIARSD